jgi:hypothetical protein
MRNPKTIASLTHLFTGEPTLKQEDTSGCSPEICSVRTDDVLCGKSSVCFQHEGNERFRQLIAKYAQSYELAITKKSKMAVVMNVVNTVLARGGRFLVSNEENGAWMDGGVKQGKKKAGFAFRDAARGRTKYAYTGIVGGGRKKSRQRVSPLSFSSVGSEDRRVSLGFLPQFLASSNSGIQTIGKPGGDTRMQVTGLLSSFFCHIEANPLTESTPICMLDGSGTFLLKPGIESTPFESTISESLPERDPFLLPPVPEATRLNDFEGFLEDSSVTNLRQFEPNRDWVEPAQLTEDLSTIFRELKWSVE